jgi:hypothetical protein
MSESAELLEGAAADGLIERREIAASARRVQRLLDMRRPKRKPDADEARDVAEAVSYLGLDVAQRGTLPLPLPPRPPLVIFPDFKEVRARFTFEGGPGGPASALRVMLKGVKGARIALAPVESKDVSRLEREARRAELVVFFCFEARRFPGQRAALELIKKTAPEKTAVCLIRSSWDKELLDRRMTALDVRGYRNCQLAAAVSRLFRTFIKPQ